MFVGGIPAGLVAQHPGEIRAQVVDSRTGLGIPGARVTLVDSGRQALSDGDGGLRFRGVEPGVVTLEADRFGYHSGRVSAQVHNGLVTRVELILEPAAIQVAPVRATLAREPRQGLDREQIRQSGARTLAGALAVVPGVVLVPRGAGGSVEIQLRGGGADQVLVLVDGTPLNDPITGAADLSTVSAAQIESLTVIPGARSARYGSGALAGVVLVETGAKSAPSEVALYLGSLETAGGELTLGAARDAVSASLGGALRRVGGEFDFHQSEGLGGGTQKRRNADLTHQSIQGGVQTRFAGGEVRARFRGDATERGVPGRSFVPSDSARQSQGAWNGNIDWTRQRSLGTLSTRLRHGRHRVRFSDPTPPLGLPFDQETRLAQTALTLSGDRSLHPAGSGPHDLLIGAGLELDHRSVQSRSLRPEGVPSTLDLAVGTHATAGWPERWGHPSVSAALRMQRDDRSDSWFVAHDLTGRVQVGGVRFHLSHRSSFSPPSAGDLFFREGVGIQPNPNLRAERVPSEVEAGIQFDGTVEGTSFHLSGEAFSGDMQDMIVWAPDFRFVWSPRNVDVHRRGAELRSRLRVPFMGFEVGGHVGHQRVTYRSGGGAPGSQVVYRPRNSAGIQAAWTSARWRIETQGRYTGLRYPVPAAANALEPFWTLRLTARGTVRTAGWTVQPLLRVDRLLDEKSPFIHAFPEPGRTLSLEMRLVRDH
jgi:outer membrane cobalamin receptor